MKLRNITNVILNRINSVDGLANEFNISCDFISKEFNQIDLHSVKKGNSFTVLVLPHLPKTEGFRNEFTCWVNLKGFLKDEKLFGDNLKGGELQ